MSDNPKPLRIGILGCAAIARPFARDVASSADVCLAAVASRDLARAQAFACDFAIPRAHGRYEALLADPEVDIVYVPLPNSLHAEWAIAAARAGKHVLCEKPLAENFALADEMAKAAEQAGLINMVNLTYRNVAALHVARKLVTDGSLGRIRHVEASYRQSWLVGNHWGDWKTLPMWLWRLSQKHGSKGVLGDVGIHILDFASFGCSSELVAVQPRLKTFHKADGDQIGEYPLDANDSAVMTVEFANGAIGVIQASRFMTGHDNELHLRIHGDKGAVEVRHFEGWTELRACTGDDVNTMAWRHIKPEPVETNYRRFINAIAAGKNEEPDFRHAANLQRVLDLCFDHDGSGLVRV